MIAAENRTELQKIKKTNKARKKLWSLSAGFHCSVIGTCFRRSELHKLAKKKVLGLDYWTGDFKLHSALVGVAGIKSKKSRLLQSLLDKKFRTYVTKYDRIRCDAELEKQWREDVKIGAVPGAYWALMTHPCAGNNLVQKVYGEVHMMGHDFFARHQKDKQTQAYLRSKVELLEEVLESERQHFLLAEERLENEIADLRAGYDDRVSRGEADETLATRLYELQEQNPGGALTDQLKAMKKEIEELKSLNQMAGRDIESLTGQLEESRKLLELTKRKMNDLEDRNELLKSQKHELSREVASLEVALRAKVSRSYECNVCEDRNTDKCPGPDLCGKTVLYVGGLHKMIPHYRQMVEKLGGRFMHHDGGKEASKTILPKLLNNADAVLCPVDCVSHFACNCVKQICKRKQKPFVMMRSSGLSSLARGLNEIIQ